MSYIHTPDTGLPIGSTNRFPVDAALANSNAQESFSGTAGVVKRTFLKPMYGLVLSNDGTVSVLVKVNGFQFEVKAGEVFEENFAPFTEVIVSSGGNVPFRAYAKGYDGVTAVRVEEFLSLQGNTYTVSAVPDTYKGAEFRMKVAKTLKYFGVFGGTPLSWGLWTTDGLHALTGTAAVASGSFPATLTYDVEGYAIANLTTPYVFVANQTYALIVNYTANGGQRLSFVPSQGVPANNDVVQVTTYFYRQSNVPAAGSAPFDLGAAYDYKLGVV